MRHSAVHHSRPYMEWKQTWGACTSGPSHHQPCQRARSGTGRRTLHGYVPNWSESRALQEVCSSQPDRACLSGGRTSSPKALALGLEIGGEPAVRQAGVQILWPFHHHQQDRQPCLQARAPTRQSCPPGVSRVTAQALHIKLHIGVWRAASSCRPDGRRCGPNYHSR